MNTCKYASCSIGKCRGCWTLGNETHHNVAQRRCAMNVRRPADILPGKPYHVYTENLMTETVTVQMFMVVAAGLNAANCIIPMRDAELPMLRDEGLIPTQWDKFYSDPTINAACFSRLSAAKSKWIATTE